MILAILKETRPGERRVAVVPETAAQLVRAGLAVRVQAGAGAGAFFDDEAYRQAGAEVVADAAAACRDAGLVVKIAAPSDEEIALLPAGSALVAVLNPLTARELVAKLAAAKVTALALDAIPRIARAQSMDVLSSMSTIAGYKAVLLGADAMGRMCPMLMTAAGTLRPASALVVGAGVAGLTAIATAKRLGAVVTAVDVRPAAKEQVESLGARFVPMDVSHEAEAAGGYAADLGEEYYRREQEVLAPHVKGSDLVVTTALVPGRAAPVLITRAMVETMKPGAVIVDLAAPAGGNCALTEPDQTVTHRGVTVLGPTNLPAAVPVHASQMFSRNVAAFLGALVADGQLRLDAEDEIVRGTLVTRDGQVVHEAARKATEGGQDAGAGPDPARQREATP